VLKAPELSHHQGLCVALAAELAREAALGLATIRRAELAGDETSMTTVYGVLGNHDTIRLLPGLDDCVDARYSPRWSADEVQIRRRKAPQTMDPDGMTMIC
jgi:hypothetical protein